MSNGIDFNKWDMDAVNAVEEEDFKEREALLKSLERYSNPKKGQKRDLGTESYGNDLPSLEEDRSPSSKFEYSNPPVANAVKRQREKEAYLKELERFHSKEKGRKRDLGIKDYGNDLQPWEEEPSPTSKYEYPDPPIVAAVKEEQKKEAFLKKQDEEIKQERSGVREVSDDDAYDYRGFDDPEDKLKEKKVTDLLKEVYAGKDQSSLYDTGVPSEVTPRGSEVVGRDLLTGREDYADPSEKPWSDYAKEAWEGTKKGAKWVGDKWGEYRKWASDPENIRWGQYLGDVIGMEKKLQGAIGDQQVKTFMGQPGSAMRAVRDAVPDSPWIDIIEMRKRDEARKKSQGFKDLLNRYFKKELGIKDDDKKSLSLKDVPKLKMPPSGTGEDDIKRILRMRDDSGGPEYSYNEDEKGFWMAAAGMMKQKKEDIGKAISEGAARTADAQMMAGRQMMGQMQGPLDLSGGTGFDVGTPVKIASKKDPEIKEEEEEEIDPPAPMTEQPGANESLGYAGPRMTDGGGPEEDYADKIGRAVTYKEKGGPGDIRAIQEDKYDLKEGEELIETEDYKWVRPIKEYTVKKGDTMSEIAERLSPGPVYGPEGSLRKFIGLNPQVENPDLIYPGQKLKWGDITKTLQGEVDRADKKDSATPSQAFDRVASVMALSKSLDEMDEPVKRRPELKIEKLLAQLEEREQERSDIEMAKLYQEKQQALRDRFRPPQTIRVVRG